jgi:hypothetical protein
MEQDSHGGFMPGFRATGQARARTSFSEEKGWPPAKQKVFFNLGLGRWWFSAHAIEPTDFYAFGSDGTTAWRPILPFERI